MSIILGSDHMSEVLVNLVLFVLLPLLGSSVIPWLWSAWLSGSERCVYPPRNGQRVVVRSASLRAAGGSDRLIVLALSQDKRQGL